jgi:hypothetical protein
MSNDELQKNASTPPAPMDSVTARHLMPLKAV